VSLADARVRRDEAKKQIAAGIDPALEKKRARTAAKYAAANTFEAVAKEGLVKCERDGLAPGDDRKDQLAPRQGLSRHRQHPDCSDHTARGTRRPAQGRGHRSL